MEPLTLFRGTSSAGPIVIRELYLCQKRWDEKGKPGPSEKLLGKMRIEL